MLILTTNIFWLLLGSAAGWINGAIMRVHTKRGVFAHLLLGGAGAEAGGWFFILKSSQDQTESLASLAAMIYALIGSMAVLAIVDQIAKQSRLGKTSRKVY